MAIVDGLEVVQVEHEHRERLTGLPVRYSTSKGSKCMAVATLSLANVRFMTSNSTTRSSASDRAVPTCLLISADVSSRPR